MVAEDTIISLLSLGLSLYGVILIKRTLDEARRATAAANRAWIKAEIVKLSFSENVYWLEIRIENVGNSPAHEVHTNVMLGVDSIESGKVTALLGRRMRADHEQYVDSSARSLFPGQSYIREWGVKLDERATNEIGIASPLLVGSVTYRNVYDSGVCQTVFAYLPDNTGQEGTTKTAAIVAAGGYAT